PIRRVARGVPAPAGCTPATAPRNGAVACTADAKGVLDDTRSESAHMAPSGAGRSFGDRPRRPRRMHGGTGITPPRDCPRVEGAGHVSRAGAPVRGLRL